MAETTLDEVAILSALLTWPRERREKLVRLILEDTGADTIDPATGRPYISSQELRGIGSGGKPAPSDEEIERWRMEKYDD